MSKDDSILTFCLMGKSIPTIEDGQKRLKNSYGGRCSLSRVMPSNSKPGTWVAYVDVFE